MSLLPTTPQLHLSDNNLPTVLNTNDYYFDDEDTALFNAVHELPKEEKGIFDIQPYGEYISTMLKSTRCKKIFSQRAIYEINRILLQIKSRIIQAAKQTQIEQNEEEIDLHFYELEDAMMSLMNNGELARFAVSNGKQALQKIVKTREKETNIFSVADMDFSNIYESSYDRFGIVFPILHDLLNGTDLGNAYLAVTCEYLCLEICEIGNKNENPLIITWVDVQTALQKDKEMSDFISIISSQSKSAKMVA
jgi:hypothetical protein